MQPSMIMRLIVVSFESFRDAVMTGMRLKGFYYREMRAFNFVPLGKGGG